MNLKDLNNKFKIYFWDGWGLLSMLRGLEKVKMQATLTFACMNLKKLAIWKHRKRLQKPSVHGKNSFFEKIKYKLLYKAKIWQRVCITRCHIYLQSETCQTAGLFGLKYVI